MTCAVIACKAPALTDKLMDIAKRLCSLGKRFVEADGVSLIDLTARSVGLEEAIKLCEHEFALIESKWYWQAQGKL